MSPQEAAADFAARGVIPRTSGALSAGDEAGAEETVVVSPEGEGSVEPPGPPQAAGASFEEWGADVAERFMSLT